MNVKEILKQGLELLRKHPVIVAPPILVSLLSGFLTVLLISGRILTMEPVEIGASGKRFAGLVVIQSVMAVVGWILYGFAQGMIAAMVVEAKEKGKTSFGRGFGAAVVRMGSLLTAGLMVGLLLMLGFMLMLIPGIIVAYLFLFTFVIIMLEGMGPFKAMKKSVRVVTNNLSSTFLLFASILLIGLAAVVVSMLLRVSIIGLLAGMSVTGAYMGYMAAVVVVAYQELTKEERSRFPDVGRGA